MIAKIMSTLTEFPDAQVQLCLIIPFFMHLPRRLESGCGLKHFGTKLRQLPKARGALL